MKYTISFLGALSSLVALAAPAAAQSDRARFDQHDRDDDGAISRAELVSTIGVVMDDWDLDGDGALNDREMTRSLFRAWDADGDRAVTAQEIAENGAGWLSSGDEGVSFARLDRDGDGSLSVFELYTGLVTAEYFRTFDPNADGRITARELANGLIATLDGNRDGALTRGEWDVPGRMG